MLRPFLYSLERASVIQTGLIYPGKIQLFKFRLYYLYCP